MPPSPREPTTGDIVPVSTRRRFPTIDLVGRSDALLIGALSIEWRDPRPETRDRIVLPASSLLVSRVLCLDGHVSFESISYLDVRNDLDNEEATQ